MLTTFICLIIILLVLNLIFYIKIEKSANTISALIHKNNKLNIELEMTNAELDIANTQIKTLNKSIGGKHER